MKIAYGTYAMPDVVLEEAIPALADVGYDGIEICVGNRHEDAVPANVDAARRDDLRGLLAGENMGVPALFLLGSLYSEDAAQHQATREHLKACAALARDLGMPQPILAMGFGARRDAWDESKDRLVDLLRDLASLAEQEGFILAGEAHCGAMLDRSERIAWVLDQVNSPNIRFHFDIVHLFLAGEVISEAVARLVPYTAHTHITDAIRNADGSFKLVLLGEGDLDAVEYMKAMQQAGWPSYITLEVSTMVWAQEGYDWRAAAQQSYEAITGAFAGAGVPRG